MRGDAERLAELVKGRDVMERTHEHFANVIGAMDGALDAQVSGDRKFVEGLLQEGGDARVTIRVLEQELTELEKFLGWPKALVAEERRRETEWEARAMSAVESGDQDLARVFLEEIERVRHRIGQAEADLAECTHLRAQYVAAISTLRETLVGE